MKRETLEQRLDAYNIHMTRCEFTDLLYDVYSQYYGRAYSIDDLLCDPAHAEKFCEITRAILCCKDVPSSLILKALLNRRKAIN